VLDSRCGEVSQANVICIIVDVPDTTHGIYPVIRCIILSHSFFFGICDDDI
jgi:hypothetical protein